MAVLVGHTLLSGTGEKERVRFLSHGEASPLASVSTLLKSRQADEPQVWPISEFLRKETEKHCAYFLIVTVV